MITFAASMAERSAWLARVAKIAPSSEWGDLLGVPVGWRGIIEGFAAAVERSGIAIRAVQIKSKHGLRIHYETIGGNGGAHPRIEALVAHAEDVAGVTCADCGQDGEWRHGNGRSRVRCAPCERMASDG